MRLTSFVRTLAFASTSKAIEAALSYGLRIDKDADPVEGPRTALPYEDAVAVAEVDVGLLSVHGPDLVDPAAWTGAGVSLG